jgi:DNA-binding response OmpR family regulator
VGLFSGNEKKENRTEKERRASRSVGTVCREGERRVMKKIIIVSPDRAVSDILQEELNEGGYEVVQAETGEEAVERCRWDTPDLVLIDTVLSGIENAGALESFRDVRQVFPILVWSAYNPRCDESPWLAPDAYIIRTASFSKVKEKIRELCPAAY